MLSCPVVLLKFVHLLLPFDLHRYTYMQHFLRSAHPFTKLMVMLVIRIRSNENTFLPSVYYITPFSVNELRLQKIRSDIYDIGLVHGHEKFKQKRCLHSEEGELETPDF